MENKNNIPLLVTFSGGRTSAFMAKYIKDNYKDRDIVYVFANTGKERIETLDFIKKCDEEWNLGIVWLEAHINEQFGVGTTFNIVDYDTADRIGNTFESMIKTYGIPCKPAPLCTNHLKTTPVQKYMRSLGYKKWETALGIRIDEKHRINWEEAKKKNYVYPLITDIRINKTFIRDWWSKQKFDLRLKDYEGNCDMCWKKSERKLMTIITERPDLIQWWDKMEKEYGGDDNTTFFRENKSAKDLMLASRFPFRKVLDEFEVSKNQTKMFEDIDIEYNCFCKLD
jgi:hypothetical protein